MRSIGFTNKYYHDEWKQETFDGSKYADGSAVQDDVNPGWSVYDGARNCMGWILEDGSFKYNGGNTEYLDTFMRAAKEAIK